MTGIVKHWLQALNTAYLRALFFNADNRAYFYTLLHEYTRSKFPLLHIFNELQQQRPGFALKEIIRLSKQALRRNEPFAANYHQSGLFTRTEIALLILGERHNCLETVTELLLRPDEQTSPVWQIIAPSIQWIAMTIVITATAVYTLPYLENFTQGYAPLFAYAGFMRANWYYTVLAVLMAGAGYALIKNNLAGTARRILSRIGLFRIHGLMLEQQFMALSAPLIQTKLPPAEFLQLMETTFAGNKAFARSLKKARGKLKELSLLQTLSEVLSRQSYNHVLASAPNQTPDEIARGLAAAGRMQRIRLNRLIKLYRNACVFLFLGITTAVTIPFALVTMGMGISPK